MNQDAIMQRRSAMQDDVDSLMDLSDYTSVPDFPIENLGCVDLNEDIFTAEHVFPDIATKKGVAKKKSVRASSSGANAPRHKNAIIEEEEKLDYRDYSNMSDDEALKLVHSELNLNINATRMKSIETFPIKLHKIIERCEIDGYSSIISWLPHGRAFMIHDTARFVSIILSKYFYLTRFQSFTRQLYLYGFQKLNCGGTGYFHELFLLGRTGLCPGIMRLKSRGFIREPDFLKLPVIYQSLSYNAPQENYNGNNRQRLVAPNQPRVVRYNNTNDMGSHQQQQQQQIMNRAHHVSSRPVMMVPHNTILPANSKIIGASGPAAGRRLMQPIKDSAMSHPDDKKVKVLHVLPMAAQTPMSYYFSRSFGF